MHNTSKQPKIIVVGSSSVDLVLNTKTHPEPGQTVLAYKSEYFFGGKGANQAVGTARLGADVTFIGCVGKDSKGQQILDNLKKEGVNISHVVETTEAATGSAYVSASEGKNAIVVVPAANHLLKPSDVEAAEKKFESADLVLIQLEVPMEVVEATVKLAQKHNLKLGIYAAPGQILPLETLKYASFIVAKSVDLPVIFANCKEKNLIKAFANVLFVRDDSNSTTFFNGSEMRYLRNDHDEILHKMGMGDAFTSGFALAFCEGKSTEDCVKFGNNVSLKVAINRGSQAGLPFLKDLQAH